MVQVKTTLVVPSSLKPFIYQAPNKKALYTPYTDPTPSPTIGRAAMAKWSTSYSLEVSSTESDHPGSEPLTPLDITSSVPSNNPIPVASNTSP